jgi:hypothetical protein
MRCINLKHSKTIVKKGYLQQPEEWMAAGFCLYLGVAGQNSMK